MLYFKSKEFTQQIQSIINDMEFFPLTLPDVPVMDPVCVGTALEVKGVQENINVIEIED